MEQEQGHTVAGRKLFIALPAYDFKVSLKLAVSLAKFAMTAPAHGVEIQIGSICGCSVVSRARNLLVRDFLDSDCTDLLFIDSDINFESEDIYRLLVWTSHRKKGIVAGCPRVRNDSAVYIETLDQENGHLTMDGHGLVRAKRVATAFMMVRRDVFATLENQNPQWRYWDDRSGKMLSAIFDFKVTPEGYMGEDYLFCDRTRELGYEVWIDPSIKLGHMGVQEYLGDFGEAVLKPMIAPMQEAAE